MTEKLTVSNIDIAATKAATDALNGLAEAADRAREAIKALVAPAHPVGIIHVDGKLTEDDMNALRDLQRAFTSDRPYFGQSHV